MQYNLVIAGVGGQGILAIAAVIARAALQDGFFIPKENRFSGYSTNRPEQFGNLARRQGASLRSVLPVHDLSEHCCQQSQKPKCEGYIRQAEIHGMSQRGGAVSAMVRFADQPIASDIIPDGTANMILSLEPLESLRHLSKLAKDGILITAQELITNIIDYPNINAVYDAIRVVPQSHIINTEELTKQIGSSRAINMLLVGVAAHYLPLKNTSLEKALENYFAKRGTDAIETNRHAFQVGFRKTGDEYAI